MKKKELQSELERLGVAFKPADDKASLERKLKKAIPPSDPASSFGALPSVEVEAPVEVPIEASEEASVEMPIEESVAVEESKEELGFLGGFKIKITALSKETLNGREYNRVVLADGTSYLLNDHDLKVQRSW